MSSPGGDRRDWPAELVVNEPGSGDCALRDLALRDPGSIDLAFTGNDTRAYTEPPAGGECGTGRGARYYAEHRHGGYRARRPGPGLPR